MASNEPVAEHPAEPGVSAAAACIEPFDQAWTELDATLDSGVMEVLRRGIAHHGEVITSQGLDGEPPQEWKVRAERLLEYRRTVETELLTPLRTLFTDGGPTRIVEAALVAALAESVTRCGALPAEVVSTWPEGALASRPSDGAKRRAGKAFARVFSAARKAGSERTLPLRAVAVGHLDSHVAPTQDKAGVAALVAWGDWSHRLEWACVRWGATAMPALIRAERPEEDDGAAVWAAVHDAAGALQAALEALVESDPRAAATTAAREWSGSAREKLGADLDIAGSFLLRGEATNPSATLADLAKHAAVLSDWDEGVGTRIQLYISLLGILSGATAVRRRTVWRFRDHCLASVTELTGIAETLEALRADLVKPGDYGLENRLGELDAAVAAALERADKTIPEPPMVDQALKDLSDTTIDALQGMIGQAPTSVDVHDIEAKAPSRGRKVERRPVPLQELARQSFDALRIERIRSSTSGLIDAINTVRVDVAELDVVYSFARDEAMRELESKEPGAGDRADDLVGGALHSISEAMRTQVAVLDTAVAAAQRRLAAEIADGSMALVERVEAGRMGARFFAAASRVTGLWVWMQERWGPPVQRAWRRVMLHVGRAQRLGARLLRRGSAIVGSAPPAAASARTLRALAEKDTLIEGLPLVYQRLFTLEPISDKALLAGRDGDLEEAMQRWRNWHDDDGVPLVVKGRQGSGITSFLNVFIAEVERDGGSVARAALNDRIMDEATLAAHLATALGLTPTDSLAHLSSAIFAAKSSSLPSAVALDNLEHLFLRVPRGTDMMERLLTLWAETEPKVFWVGGVTVSAWKLISTAEPMAVSQIDVFELEPLSSAAMRSAITLRHRRSGLAIRYQEPTGTMHRLRQRLRRLRRADEDHSQAEVDFFDRLYRASGGYLGLALFQWLKAADFTSGEGVAMRPPERPDFSVLDALNITQNFTLKAFLEHRSLTLDEHDRIFRVSRQESYQIIESLRNRHLLEPLAVPGSDPEARSEIEEELRYRVRPLLMGAVISHLQSRNIVH